VDYFLDISGLVLGLVTAVLIPLALWILNRDRRKSEMAREALDRDYEERQRAYQQRLRDYEELKEAFDIHESLTQIEVIESLTRADSDDTAKRFLVELHARASYRFKEFSADVALPSDLASMIVESVTTIHVAIPEQTLVAQRAFEAKVKQKQNHAKNADVQDRVGAFASRLAGRPLEAGESSETVSKFRDVASSIRLSGAGQGVEIGLPDGVHKIWFAGSNKGDIPAVLTHFDAKGCSLASSKSDSMKSRLQKKAASGKGLADAFVEELRGLAKASETCGCGAPLRFS